MSQKALVFLAASALGACSPAFAQSAPPSSSPWNGLYVGGSLGESRYEPFCWLDLNHDCDKDSTAGKLFAGARLNPHFGVEAAYIDFGSIDFAGGQTRAEGLDLSLTGRLDVASHTALVGRLGFVSGYATVSGTTPGLINDTRTGIEPSYGLGVQQDISANWTLRGDLDRYRIKFSDGEHGMLGLLTLGVQWNFR
jgi:hypothetical protein